jgi:hypothetical protein
MKLMDLHTVLTPCFSKLLHETSTIWCGNGSVQYQEASQLNEQRIFMKKPNKASDIIARQYGFV